MNRYDDIKRFKEKAKLKDIDYKEIHENFTEESASGWAILDQLSASDSASGPLNNGRTTRTTLIPTASDELVSLRPASATVSQVKKPAPSPRAPVLRSGINSIDTTTPSASYANTFAQIDAVLPIETPIAAAPVADPAPAVKSMPVTPIVRSMPTSPIAQSVPTPPAAVSADDQRFKRMFNQKVPQLAARNSGRDTPLQPLLEMIALCR